MILFKKTAALTAWVRETRNQRGSIGFVPTMGALHEGHLSLLKASKAENGLTIASIFVNPTQFNNPVDFQKYPNTIEKDIELLEAAGCDVLFWPPVDEVYPDGTSALEHYDLGYLETILEGKYRPGHFQGVCEVMRRLLDIVLPDNLYMGQKDYQQCMVVKRLLEIMQSGIRLHTRPTLREPDGLAMSSRNLRLNETERQHAIAISKVLSFIKKNLRAGLTQPLKQTGIAMLEEKGFKVDYVEIADAETLALIKDWDGRQKAVALIAAFQHEVRLIDNMLL
jgi:pantoate--beta-alanine ligase